MHEPLRSTGQWLQFVVRGYFQYHAVPGNTPTLSAFRFRLVRLWRHAICRRSQEHPPSWERLAGLFRRWLPQPHVLHPYPHVRFDATIQGRSRMRYVASRIMWRPAENPNGIRTSVDLNAT